MLRFMRATNCNTDPGCYSCNPTGHQEVKPAKVADKKQQRSGGSCCTRRSSLPLRSALTAPPAAAGVLLGLCVRKIDPVLGTKPTGTPVNKSYEKAIACLRRGGRM